MHALTKKIVVCIAWIYALEIPLSLHGAWGDEFPDPPLCVSAPAPSSGRADKIDCPLPFVNEIPAPTPRDGCSNMKIWTEGFRAGLAGNAHPSGMEFFPAQFSSTPQGMQSSLRFLKGMQSPPPFLRSMQSSSPFLKRMQSSSEAPLKEIVACSGYEAANEHQCCLDAYYKGMTGLRKNFEHADDWLKDPKVSEDDKNRIRQCSREKLHGEQDGQIQCLSSKFRETKACPIPKLVADHYQGCYLLGFLEKIRAEGCPLGHFAQSYMNSQLAAISDKTDSRPPNDFVSSDSPPAEVHQAR